MFIFLISIFITFWPVLCETFCDILLFTLHLIVTVLLSFLRLKRWITINKKTQELKQWKLNISLWGMTLENPYCTSVYFEDLRGHIHCSFCFVKILRLHTVHSSKKQCYVTSCCIWTFSCDVKITSRAQPLFSASKEHDLPWGRYICFFKKRIIICLWVFLSSCFICIVSYCT